MLTRRLLIVAGSSVLAAPAIAKMMPVVKVPADYVPKTLIEQDEVKKFFEGARSKEGGPCCSTADGFIKGYTYRVWEPSPSGSAQLVDRIMFKSIKRDGEVYLVEAYDKRHYHDYVVLTATYDCLVHTPNPAGAEVVWLYYPNTSCQVRCLATMPDT